MSWQELSMNRWCGALAIAGLVACGGDDGGDEAADTSGTQGDDDDDSGTSPESDSGGTTSPDGSSSDPTLDGSDGSDSGGGSCVWDCNPDGVVMWQARWGTEENWDNAYTASVGSDGRIAIGGGIFPPLTPPAVDGFVAAWDQDGGALFDESIGERVSGSAALGDDIVFVGDTDAQALWLSRRDTSGASVWDSVDDSGMVVFPGPVIALPGDELFTAGGAAKSGFVAHYDDAGMQLGFVPTTANVYIGSLVLLDGDIVVLGDDTLGGYWLTRMDATGDVVWERVGMGVPTAMTLTDEGEIAVIAIVPAMMSTYPEIQRWDDAGTELSGYPIAQGDAMVYDLLPLPGGDIVMAGATTTDASHCWIARTDPTNATVWQVWFVAEAAESECRTVDFAPDDTFYASGSRLDGEDVDAWVMRFDPE